MTRDDYSQYAPVPRRHEMAPTKEQIQATTDPVALKEIMNKLQDSEIAIGVNLEYSNGDDAWRGSAMAALIYTKVAIKNIKARLNQLASERSALAKAAE